MAFSGMLESCIAGDQKWHESAMAQYQVSAFGENPDSVSSGRKSAEVSLASRLSGQSGGNLRV